MGLHFNTTEIIVCGVQKHITFCYCESTETSAYKDGVRISVNEDRLDTWHKRIIFHPA